MFLPRNAITLAAITAVAAWVAGPARADEVLFNNGDRLSGTIDSVDGGKLKIRSKVAGDVTVDLRDVKTLASDRPVTVRLLDGTTARQRLVAAEAGSVALAGEGAAAPPLRKVALAGVKKINPMEAWTGSAVVGGLLTRGNSNTESLNVSIDAARRTDEDRVTVSAGYSFGRERNQDTGDKTTTTDNWFAFGKYDYFFTPKFYAFGAGRVERDRIADLDLRLTPSAGVGYQWVERPDFNVSTEAGVAWVHEEFTDDGNDEHVAARLAYHVDKELNDRVNVFHNLTYYPSVEELNDYNIVTDAGIRASLTEQMFTEFKLEFKYDAMPAPGASRSDLRYLLGVGWKF